MAATMSGATSRRKGHAYEVETANQLAQHTGQAIVTSRAVGSNYGSDISTILHYDKLGRAVAHLPWVEGGDGTKWAIECKNVKVRAPKTWLTQAVEQSAPGTTPVVLWKRRHKPFEEGSAFLLCDESRRGWREVTIGEWLGGLACHT